MLMPYPLCVFLESREQGKLSTCHPFYIVTQDALRDIIKCSLILDYMAKTTLAHADEDAVKQRVQEIIQYLQNHAPTVSGSDSPAMDSSFTEMRMYSGCGKNLMNRRIARQHVYIQKYLIDAWLNTYTGADQDRTHYL